jgi:heme A synthase
LSFQFLEVKQLKNMKTDAMTNHKDALEFVSRCLLYSFIVISIDFVVVFFLSGEYTKNMYLLSFIALIEGGMALIIGGAVASYSPLSAKLSEIIFHTKPWNAKRQKEVEANARTWITTGVFLVLGALLLSAF